MHGKKLLPLSRRRNTRKDKETEPPALRSECVCEIDAKAPSLAFGTIGTYVEVL